ncbi:MAG TPA: tRNA uridine-5-carboxymethylaminomethyl(34) synthesis GTPase MnmE [Pyrinomonadaceae bacterium]|nr:tRNA uridine-5-carboxymethylaminomethyl(34) synthesis GTPase MnmE [Pyrinomonadaceae bacterium]
MDTIVALATPLGRSGIAVIRLSGDAALNITKKLVGDEKFAPQPRFAALKKIYDPAQTKELIDEVIITYFKSPHSFTGEDLVEISCHGAPVIIRQIIDICLQLDARMAEAGEFSLRALSNGRMNLSQAEAIRDLIEARTIASARQAVRQLRGELSSQLQPLKDDLLDVIVVLESTLEFVEDDLPAFQTENIKIKLFEIAEKIQKMALTFQAGRLLREGIKVALVGRPNVGKSSLFNSLIGYERAIVTDIPGTTRDSLHESLSIDGIPVSLIDTAGLRETTDMVENIGVTRTKGTLSDADLIIVVLDNSERFNPDDYKVLEEVKDLNYIIAVNKVDLDGNGIDFEFPSDELKYVSTSAKTGEGIEALKKAIFMRFSNQDIEDKSFLVSDARHKDLLVRAETGIKTSCALLEENASEEIVLVGLHNALRFLGQITGETTTEDMLTRIFSTFCIGK